MSFQRAACWREAPCPTLPCGGETHCNELAGTRVGTGPAVLQISNIISKSSYWPVRLTESYCLGCTPNGPRFYQVIHRKQNFIYLVLKEMPSILNLRFVTKVRGANRSVHEPLQRALRRSLETEVCQIDMTNLTKWLGVSKGPLAPSYSGPSLGHSPYRERIDRSNFMIHWLIVTCLLKGTIWGVGSANNTKPWRLVREYQNIRTWSSACQAAPTAGSDQSRSSNNQHERGPIH